MHIPIGFFISETSVFLHDGPNPSGWGEMRKQFVCLAVICVIAVAAFVSISIYREDVRSDLVPLNDSLDGGLFGKVGATIDGEPYEIAELYSQIRPVYNDGDRVVFDSPNHMLAQCMQLNGVPVLLMFSKVLFPPTLIPRHEPIPWKRITSDLLSLRVPDPIHSPRATSFAPSSPFSQIQTLR